MTTPNAIEPATLMAARMFADRVRRDFSVKQVLLYGSRARGDHKPDSDVDLAVLLARERRERVRVAGEMADALGETLFETGLVLSAFPIWQDEWDNPELVFNPWHIRNLKLDGIPV